MTILYREIIGAIAVLLSVAGLLPYIKDIFAKKTKPHLYTWLVWTPLTFIAFFAQIKGKGGPGAWATGISAVLALIILLLSIKNGTKDVTRSDTYCLIGAALAIILWIFVKNPVVSIILVTLIDVLGFVPTWRKTLNHPTEETLSSYVMSFSKHSLSIVALNNISILTALYPAAVGMANGMMIVTIKLGRRKLYNRKVRESGKKMANS